MKKIPVFYKDKKIGHINLDPKDIIKEKSEQIIHFDEKIPDELLEKLRGGVNVSMGLTLERNENENT